MTRLDKITIQGFKSFQKRVSIPFPKGFSCITGPNGSGKSNISDAIIFVLGKASSKTIRAKKAENLVFHGSKKKKASDYALVSLYFDNAKNTFPFDEDIVTVSRRLNKKGVSTYRLNGKIVTRQQINDVLAQAKIYADGHNIIKQGDVTQIVDMDPIQRRSVIDEIAGIAEYDEKRERALKELDKIAERVREAEILITEKSQTLERLKKERDAAVAFQNLENHLKKIRSVMVWREYSRSNDSLKEVEKSLEQKDIEAKKIEQQINKIDSDVAEYEKNLEQLTKDVVEASSHIEASNRISELRYGLETKREKIESNKREIERIESFSERLQSFDTKANPAYKSIATMKGVEGTVSELISVPSKYRTAVEVASGSHLKDIVVDSQTTAAHCIKFLKEKRVGRSRFLPLDKIRPYPGKTLPEGAIGWISDLIKYNKKFSPAMEYIFATTACVTDIDTAKKIFSRHRIRMVTLDGDLIEASGAMTGGFYKRRSMPSQEIEKFSKNKQELQNEIYDLEKDIIRLNKELEKLATKEQKTKTFSLERNRVKLDEALKKSRERRKDLYEQRLEIQQETGKLNIKKARLEAKFDNLKVQWEGPEKGIDLSNKQIEELRPYSDMKVTDLKIKETEVMQDMEALGPVNMKAMEDFEFLKQEFDEFRVKVEKIMEEKQSIEDTIKKIEDKRLYTFNHTLEGISKNFKAVYKDITNGGVAELSLQDPTNIESGLMIRASPPGKKLLNIDSMSGGEKTLTAFSFVFAIQRHKPTPFYVLDEADAALDKINTRRVAGLLKKQSKLAQFIIISHNDNLVKEADQIYGITMEEGESKIMGVKLSLKTQAQN